MEIRGGEEEREEAFFGEGEEGESTFRQEKMRRLERGNAKEGEQEEICRWKGGGWRGKKKVHSFGKSTEGRVTLDWREEKTGTEM